MRQLLGLGLLAALMGCASPRGLGARAAIAVGGPSAAHEAQLSPATAGALLALTYRVVVVTESDGGLYSPVPGATVRAWDAAALAMREATTGPDGSAVLVLSGPLVDAWVLLEERVVRVRGPQVPDRFQAGAIHVLAVMGD